MTTSTDAFETVQRFDHRTAPWWALQRHIHTELQEGIAGPRRYEMRQERDGREWITESFPAGPGTGREPGAVYDLYGTGETFSMDSSVQFIINEFPCCAGETCPACGGDGNIEQQVYYGRPEPIKTSVCANCGGTGRLQPEGHGE